MTADGLSTKLDATDGVHVLGVGAPGRPERIGAKAAALDAVRRAGAATPSGFAIDVDAAEALRSGGAAGVDALDMTALSIGVAAIEAETARRFGEDLLLCVRLSPVTPMPELTPPALAIGYAPTSGPRPADARRFWRSWAPMALGTSAEALDDAADAAIAAEPLIEAQAMAAAEAIARAAGSPDATPPDIWTQLKLAAIGAAALWRSTRVLRRRRAVQAEDACAILVQAMSPDTPGAGAGWIRLHDPETGADAPIGRFTPGRFGGVAPIEGSDERALSELAPDLQAEIVSLAARVEDAVGPPQETLFTLDPTAPPGSRAQAATLRVLRVSATAGLEIAVRRADAGRISRAAAIEAVAPESLVPLLHPTLAPTAPRDALAHGLAASPGAASGRLAFTAAAAEAIAQTGGAAVLARSETTPEDVAGMHAAAAVLTTRGGLTSHAAVVARGLGRPCVVGASDARIDVEAETFVAADGRILGAGDEVTVDGGAGELLAGRLPTREPTPSGAFARLMHWADGERRMRVRANADTPQDAAIAVRLGADGIGLCRTEHMFFDPDRISAMREMILADDADERRAALARLLPMQRADFAELFKIMDRAAGPDAPAAPVTIRLLDPPLHEFLPQGDRELAAMAASMGAPTEKVARRAAALREFNPMLGQRGCRLGVAFPEIYEMQARAIFEAAHDVGERIGRHPRPEIMIPLVSAVRELEVLRAAIAEVAASVRQERGGPIAYEVGIMIETPRAALRAGALAGPAAFFSFGTNDLTQMTYGLSRDDAGRLMRTYVERGVFEADPFQSLDQEGVGELMRLAAERGRAAAPLTLGVCGEHGGDPATIQFCEDAAFDYVSCSPFRAPIARLAAAQATLRRARRGDGAP